METWILVDGNGFPKVVVFIVPFYVLDDLPVRILATYEPKSIGKRKTDMMLPCVLGVSNGRPSSLLDVVLECLVCQEVKVAPIVSKRKRVAADWGGYVRQILNRIRIQVDENEDAQFFLV